MPMYLMKLTFQREGNYNSLVIGFGLVINKNKYYLLS